MAQNPKYDNDMINLGYLNKRLGQTEESISKNNNSISQLPKNYSTPPNPPYYKDSLLCYGNKIYRCNTTKLKGEFSWNDWIIVATDDTTVSDFINNTYELDKLEIQEQIDGKVQTYYQENDPSKEWATDLDKGRHVGDYWYNTTNDTQWRYNRITIGASITYGWGQVNIPKAVFDTIDSKKSIYTEKPTSYQKDDLWIIEKTLSDEDLPVGTDENPIAKGDWVFSIANSEVYNKEHWVKRDEDIGMTYIKQHYYTIGEINSSFEEIERNTDSKITKAKDEISLSVSQTYTTKEEHEATIYDFDEKIGTINQTITDHKKTISDLSIEVGEITSTVESIQTTTKELEVNVDGVSADFEDFKDNEYIQSIDNLQKQIDGAIQFWNGAEIPTINNYPANQWTTENDRINHQADIYTVIQDVEGEMKQGKSYRFDKIDGVWQWIELTDNELSAVQAIAQEALDKADANATEIGTVKTRVSSLEQTDEQIKASVESIDKQIIPTSKVSGSNVHIEEASDKKMVNFEIEGKSEQETRSGKNLFNKNKAMEHQYIANGTEVSNRYSLNSNEDIIISYSNYTHGRSFFNKMTLEAGTYTLSFITSTSGENKQIMLSVRNMETLVDIFSPTNLTIVDGTKYSIQFILSATTTIGISINPYIKETGTLTLEDIQLEEGSTATEYEQYGVSPSSDYPSEIKGVGYENLFDGLLELGSFTAMGENSVSTNCVRTVNYINIQPNTNYYIYNSLGYTTTMQFFDENKIFISEGVAIESEFTTPSNAKYMRWRSSIGNKENNLEVKYQLTKGSKKKAYIPYGKYGIEVETVGKNRLQNDLISQTKNGITVTINEDKSITFNGTTSAYTEFILSDNLDITLKNGIKYILSTHKEGTISGGNSYFNIISSDKTELYVYNNNTSVNSMTPSADINIIKSNIVFGANCVLTNFTIYPMLEENQDMTEYQPYQERTSVIELNAPLRSLPNRVKDIAYIKNNILCVDRKVGTVVLDGSDDENWTLNGSNQGYGIVINDVGGNSDSSIISGGYCDCLSETIQNNIYSGRKDNVFATLGGTTHKIYVRYNSSITSIALLKEQLNSQPIIVQYELAEPYIEKIGEVEIPRTFKGVNNITTTDELEPIMNIEYVRDTILSDYVEGQVSNAVAIQERKNAEFQITNEEIKSTVSAISTNLDGTKSSLKSVEEKITSQEKTIKIISKNIDSTTGNITEVTTTNGFTFNSNGLKIYIDENSYNTVIDNVGTYYKDGDEVINQTTKDGSILTNLSEKGQTKYSYNENDDYDFIEERIESDGEYAYATFYNGEE